jgi:hypothetical protein
MALPDSIPQVGPLRRFGPVVLAYLVVTAFTRPFFWGDSVDYARDVVTGTRLWEFGHLFWRPLGQGLAPALRPATQALGLYDQAGAVCVLAAVSWLAGLGCVVLLRSLVGRACPHGVGADLVTLAFLVSQAFLNYAPTACSYVPGLFLLLLGCHLLTRAAERSQPSWGTALAAGAALAGSLCFWFLYLWALPAALLLPVLLPAAQRERWRLSLWAGAACLLLTGCAYAFVLAGLGIHTVAGVRAWIAESSHGVANVSGVARLAFGLPRSFLCMGQDGLLFKRFLLKDPYNPVSLADLFRLSLWEIALFYLFLAALARDLARSAAGRRYLALLALAAVPTLGFAAAWQGGDMERYLPLYPFLFPALAAALAAKSGRGPARVFAAAFFAVAAWSNLGVMAMPVRERCRQELAERVRELQEQRSPDSVVLIVRDELQSFYRNYPLHPLSRPLDPEAAVTPGLAETSRWRPLLATRLLAVWDGGGEVWVSQRVYRPAPRPEWSWAEGEDCNVTWADIHAFFDALETCREVGGDDGFRLLSPTPCNRRALEAWKAR